MALFQQGVSGSGLQSEKIFDIDLHSQRPKLPPRALPESVRASLGFKADTANAKAEKEVVPKPITGKTSKAAIAVKGAAARR